MAIKAIPFGFSGRTYKGIPVIPTFTDKTITSFKVILRDGTETVYDAPFTDISTDNWPDGPATAILYGSVPQVLQFSIVDPAALSNRIAEIEQQIKDIDDVINSRLSSDGILSINIVNKQIMYLDPSALLALKNNLIKQLNDLNKNAGISDGNNPFKSRIQIKYRG